MKNRLRYKLSQITIIKIIGKLIYIFIAVIFQSICKLFFIKMWYRNSFKLGYYQPFISDLDITFYSSSTLQKDIFLWLYYIFKKIFLIFGEVNFINPSFIGEPIVGTINYYELLRDPILLDTLNINKQHDEIQKNIFLLKMLWSDRKYFDNFHIRIPKWKHHFYILNIQHSDHITPSTIVSQCNYPRTLQLTTFIEHLIKNIPLVKLLYLFPREFLFINPIAFMATMIHFRIKKLPFENISEYEKKHIEHHIYWELWGLYTQAPVTNTKEMYLHLQHINDFLKLLDIQSDQIKNSIQFIQRYITKTI